MNLLISRTTFISCIIYGGVLNHHTKLWNACIYASQTYRTNSRSSPVYTKLVPGRIFSLFPHQQPMCYKKASFILPTRCPIEAAAKNKIVSDDVRILQVPYLTHTEFRKRINKSLTFEGKLKVCWKFETQRTSSYSTRYNVWFSNDGSMTFFLL